jgi:hypothetical protein
VLRRLIDSITLLVVARGSARFSRGVRPRDEATRPSCKRFT